MKRINELINGLTHGIGGLLAIATLVILVVSASIYGSVWRVIGGSFSHFWFMLRYVLYI